MQLYYELLIKVLTFYGFLLRLSFCFASLSFPKWLTFCHIGAFWFTKSNSLPNLISFLFWFFLMTTVHCVFSFIEIASLFSLVVSWATLQFNMILLLSIRWVSCFLRGSCSSGGLLYSFKFSFFGGMNSGFVLVFLVSCEICGFWTHIQKRISFELFIVLVQWSLCCCFLWCSIQIYMGLDLMMVHIEFFV